MQPVHLAIGIVEGLVTASVISFVYNARPEILQGALEARHIGAHPIRKVVLAFLAAAVLAGGFLSWFASEHPDGLEWSITKVTGQKELKGSEHWNSRHADGDSGKAVLPAGLFVQKISRN